MKRGREGVLHGHKSKKKRLTRFYSTATPFPTPSSPVKNCSWNNFLFIQKMELNEHVTVLVKIIESLIEAKAEATANQRVIEFQIQLNNNQIQELEKEISTYKKNLAAIKAQSEK